MSKYSWAFQELIFKDASDFAVAAYIISVSLNDLMHGVNCFKAYNGNILAS